MNSYHLTFPLIVGLLFLLIFNGFFTNFSPTASAFNTGTILIDAAYLVLFGVSLIMITANGLPKMRYGHLLFFSFGLMVCSTIGLVVMSPNPPIERILGARNYVAYGAVFLLLPSLVTQHKVIAKVLGVLTALGVTSAAFGIAQATFRGLLPNSLLVLKDESVFSFYQTAVVRPTGLLGNTIIYVGFLTIIFSLISARLLTTYRSRDVIFLFTVSTAIVLSFSRAGIVTAGLIFFINYVLVRGLKVKSVLRLFLLILLVGLFIATFTIVYSDSLMVNRFLNQEVTSQQSTQVHYRQVSLALETIANHPLFGVGLGSQGISSRAATKIITDGFWFQYLLELGIFGTFLYLLFALICLGVSVTILRSNKNALVTVLAACFISTSVGFFLMGFVNSAFTGRVPYIVYWLVFGLLLAADRTTLKRNRVLAQPEKVYDKNRY